VQDDVTAKIVSALSLNLSASDLRRIAADHTNNLEAHDCYQRGREMLRRFAREANHDAQPLLRRAIELDSRFAPAYALLAGALVIDSRATGAPRPRRPWKRLRKPRDRRYNPMNGTTMPCGRSAWSVFGLGAMTKP
jgi:hypothetical protein